ncbi:MAG: hypothetical protein M1819_006728 [Sarea resinae]|nr:MAG: hypothetical protein M1819_006728 [Sarea resinae]
MSKQSRVASVEDYNSDNNETLPETRTIARRKPAGRSGRVPAKNPDVASDSGYSSHTAATVGSGDSGSGAKLASAKESNPSSPNKRRPPVAGSGRRSMDKLPPRTASRNQRRDSGIHEECDCPECIARSRGPLESHWDINYQPFNGIQRPPSRYNGGPPSPQAIRHPGPGYISEAPIIQTARSRPRAASTHIFQPRPVSYQGGMMSDPYGRPPGIPYERGPPPSMPMYSNPAYAIPPSYPPPGASFLPPSRPQSRQDYPPPSPYERPSSRNWPAAGQYSTRPKSVYGTPVVEYDQPNFPQQPNGSSNQRRTRRESNEGRDEDYYKMPPPPPPQIIPIARPPMRHSVTANLAREIQRPSSASPYVATTKAPAERVRGALAEPTMRPRRPSLASNSSSRKYATYSNDYGAAKVSVEGPNRRRVSYDGHGRAGAIEQRQRAAEDYQETAAVTSVPLTADALRQARRGMNPSSDSGSHSRTSSSRDGSDLKTRSGSGLTHSDGEGFTLRFNGVKLDFSGDFDGRTINIKPGEEGGQAELSVGGRSKPRYIERTSNAAQIEYARSGLRRQIEDGERPSRRSSRSGR